MTDISLQELLLRKMTSAPHFAARKSLM